MRFTKMHGLGNDYVYVNCFRETVENPSQVAIQVSDRHTGIGSDGLILIEPSDKADFFMSMYNADGSRSEMCGNGIRCVGKYVYDFGLTDKTQITVDTLAGIKYLDLTVEDGKVSMVRVNMGAPILDPKQIPVDSSLEQFINEPVKVDDAIYQMTAVSMGNPHAITFVDDVRTCPLEIVGPKLEVHPLFPRRANIEFVQVHSRKEISMRVWERGTGETMACGTGTCATLVACVLNDKTDTSAVVHLLGGDLFIEWDRDENVVYMTGPATTVFNGELEL
jgi:diaminopimelate epimerase